MRRRQDGAQASLHASQRTLIRDKSARGPVSGSPLLLHMPPVFGVNLGRQEAIALYAPQTILRAYLSTPPPFTSPLLMAEEDTRSTQRQKKMGSVRMPLGFSGAGTSLNRMRGVGVGTKPSDLMCVKNLHRKAHGRPH